MAASDLEILLALPAHLSGLQTLERLVEEPRISAPFRAGLRREITRAHAARRAHEGGARWSGMQADPYRVKPAREIARETDAALARAASPAGRFLAALRRCEAADPAELDPAQTHKIRAEFLRNHPYPDSPPVACSIGACLILLDRLDHAAAREAIAALGEMLAQARRAA
jgi:hypothetical protein